MNEGRLAKMNNYLEKRYFLVTVNILVNIMHTEQPKSLQDDLKTKKVEKFQTRWHFSKINFSKILIIMYTGEA